jgi:chitinase
VAAATSAVLALGAFTALGLGTAQADTASSAQPAAAAAGSGGVNIAYYDQWSIYGNAFYPKNLDTEGIAGKLDILNYSFENIDPVNLTCFEATKASDSTNESNPNAGDGAGDAFADYQKSFGADISVDGVGDTWNQPLVGNFNQLKKLKAKHPNLKILISLGGWTYSKYFSDAAATDASRKKLVSSCIDMFIKGNLPVQGGYGGTGAAAGIFDGFDLDWEYPGSPNGHVGNHYSPNDKANFTKLAAEFRSELDAYGAANGGRKMLLTAAMPSGQDKIANVETDKIGQYLDYANIMTYDMHGAWDATGPTNFQDPLYESSADPSTPVSPGTEKYSIDHAVTAWTTGDPAYGIPGGFPASKITMGYPMYYRGWTGVSAGGNHGLYSSASGPSQARGISQVAGTAYYKELTGVVDNSADTFYDPATQSNWFYDGTNFWTGLGAQSIQAKADYAHCHGLAGSMMYSLLDLDPQATLFNKIVTATDGSTSGCTTPPQTGGTTTGGTTDGGTTAGTTDGGTTAGTTDGGTTAGTTDGGTTGGTTCTLPSWSASAIYVGGNQVSWKGHNWKAKWWTTNEEPGTTGEWGVWQDLGAC